MTRTLLALALFIASLAVTVATATGAEVARKAENAGTVDLYKDPG